MLTGGPAMSARVVPRFLSLREPRRRARVTLRPVSAREPAEERAEREACLGCQRDIGRHARDDAERQADDGSQGYSGSDSHGRECMFAA